MSVIMKDADLSEHCETCKFSKKYGAVGEIYCKLLGEYFTGNVKPPYKDRADECPLKSVDGLVTKILEEVDGGTDDKYIRYTDIVDRVTQSVKEYCEEV